LLTKDLAAKLIVRPWTGSDERMMTTTLTAIDLIKERRFVYLSDLRVLTLLIVFKNLLKNYY
jgi:hypothetical protein